MQIETYSTVFIQKYIANSISGRRRITSLVHPYDAPEALPLQEQVEGLVDLPQADFMRDQAVQLQLLHGYLNKESHQSSVHAPKWQH